MNFHGMLLTSEIWLVKLIDQGSLDKIFNGLWGDQHPKHNMFWQPNILIFSAVSISIHHL